MDRFYASAVDVSVVTSIVFTLFAPRQLERILPEGNELLTSFSGGARMRKWFRIVAAIGLLLFYTVYRPPPAWTQGGDYCQVPICTNLSSFNPSVFIVSNANAFSVSGTFTLSVGTFNPVTDDVIVQLGTFQRFVGVVGASITILAGSFQPVGLGTFAYFGPVIGATGQGEGVIFLHGGPNSYAFQIGASGVLNLPTANPPGGMAVGLKVGGSGGLAIVSATFLNPSGD